MSFEYVLLLLLTILASVLVLWYFLARRRLIRLIKKVTEDLEKAFRPVDKTYRLLGYLVGYTAKYILESGDRVYILFTTVPRHSLTYYLIAKYMSRTDKLELAYENTKRYVTRELHFVLESDRRSRHVVLRDLGEKLSRLSNTVVEVAGRKYIVYYEDPKDVDKVAKLVASHSLPVRRVSAYTENNLVEVVSDIAIDSVNEVVKLLREVNKLLTKEKTPREH